MVKVTILKLCFCDWIGFVTHRVPEIFENTVSVVQ